MVGPALRYFKADLEPEGHTAVRCKVEKEDTNDADAGGFNDASVPETNDAPGEEVGDWNAGGGDEGAL